MKKIKSSFIKNARLFFILVCFISLFLSCLSIKAESNIDSDNDGYSDDLEKSYNTDYDNNLDYPADYDDDKIPDDGSIDGIYAGDADDDNDGIDDLTEDMIGSNSKNSSDVFKFSIDNSSYYLVDNNKDNIFDKLLNKNGKITNVKHIKKNKYYLDTTGNMKWDTVYVNGDIKKYTKPEEKFEIPWLILIPTIIFIVLIIVFLLFKFEILYLYEEYVEE